MIRMIKMMYAHQIFLMKMKINIDIISNISEIKTKNIIKEDEPLKEDIGIILTTLPESEVIEPDEPLPEEGKVQNPNFCKNYISNLLNPIKLEIDPNILSGVELGLNKILYTLQDDMEEKKLEINPEQKNVNEIKKSNNNASMIGKGPVVNFEASIKMQKIKELSQRKKDIEKQINQINENIKLINDEKTSNLGGVAFEYPSNIVEDNIKKAQLKENKQTKELLLAKLNGINERNNERNNDNSLIKNERIANMSELLKGKKGEIIRLILIYLSSHDVITTKIGCELTGKSSPQVRRYLNILVDAGVLIESNSTKNKTYTVNPKLKQSNNQ